MSLVPWWMMQVQFPQPDGRGVVKRKWAVAKDAGPLVFFAERLVKRMISFGWPLRYAIPDHNYLWPRLVILEPASDTPEFRQALVVHLAAIEIDCAWSGLVSGLELRLVGDPVLKLRFGVDAKGRFKVVGADIVAAPDVPF